jgi:hypothetical protein
MAVRKYETPVARYRATPHRAKAQPKINAAVPIHVVFSASRRKGKA